MITTVENEYRTSWSRRRRRFIHPAVTTVGIILLVGVILLVQFANFNGTFFNGTGELSFDVALVVFGNSSSNGTSNNISQPTNIVSHPSDDNTTWISSNASYRDRPVEFSQHSTRKSLEKESSQRPMRSDAPQNATNSTIATTVLSRQAQRLSPVSSPKPPLDCRFEQKHRNDNNTHHGEVCCGTWDISSDEWWLSRPDWDVSMENDTHYCFSPLDDPIQASFLRDLHAKQWDNINCTDIEKSVEVNSGYGASTAWLMKAFWHALTKSHKPFQIIHNYRRWLYSTGNRSSWAYCETEDSRCYYLPINPCNRTFYNEGREHSAAPKPHKNAKLKDRLEFYWMSQYLFRRNHLFRHQLFKFRKHYQFDSISAPCLTMHVRRGDAGLPQPPFRRYAAVQEYLDAVPNLTQSDTIVLLTDDQSTIDEVQRYHSDKYNWRYLDRPRVQNISGGFDGHLPSDDAAFEMLVLDTELTVASRCNRFVFGQSGFVTGMLDAMDLDNKLHEGYFVDTSVSKEEARKFADKEARAASLMIDIARQNQNLSSQASPSHAKDSPKLLDRAKQSSL